MVDQGANRAGADKRRAFYSQDQGSQLMPLTWLQALRQPDGAPLLADSLAADQTKFDFVLETTDCSARDSGNSRCGHDYGTNLSPQEKSALIEYLKTL